MFRGYLPSPPVSLQWTPAPRRINASCSRPTMWVPSDGSLCDNRILNHGRQPSPANWSDRRLEPPTARERPLGEREREFKRCDSLTWEQPAALPVCPLCCCACVCSRGAMGPLLHPAPRSPTTRPNCPTATRTRIIGPSEAGSGISSLFWKSTLGRMPSMWER